MDKCWRPEPKQEEPNYEPKPHEIDSIKLFGYRQHDGYISLGQVEGGTYLPNFPPQINVLGRKYSLQTTEKLTNGSRLEWAVYFREAELT